jgi:hypothetical protein
MAFSGSMLLSIAIPENVTTVEASAFSYEYRLSAGQRVVCRSESNNGFLTKPNGFYISHGVTIPEGAAIPTVACSLHCSKLLSVRFQVDELTRIESNAFECTPLKAIAIPCRFEIVGSDCLRHYHLLCSVKFAPGCRLQHIEEGPVAETVLRSKSCSFPSGLDFPPLHPRLEVKCDGLHDIPIFMASRRRLLCRGPSQP